jgi:hypothetical protein
LNAWAGGLVGLQNRLVCEVRFAFDDDAGAHEDPIRVSLADLRLNGLDFLFLSSDAASGELNQRLERAARAGFTARHPGVAAREVVVNLYPALLAGETAAGERLQFLRYAHALAASARPATLRDFVNPATLHGKDPDAVDGIDAAELAGRVLGPGADSLRQSFQDALSPLAAAGAANAAAIEAMLDRASLFGIPDAIPLPGVEVEAGAPEGSAPTREGVLRPQAERVRLLMETRLAASDAKWNPPTLPDSDVVRICSEAADALLGARFPLMPRVTLPAEVAGAALPADNPGPGEVQDWLFTASAVRPETARLQTLRVLAEEWEQPLDDLEVLQWPDGLGGWMARETPPASYQGNLVGIAVQPLGGFDPGRVAGGLVIDEWQEVIPAPQETTAYAFHYDAPNSEPPQSLLLAVSQYQGAPRWSWNELAACVDQAFRLAKMRAVGPDELRTTKIDVALPATLLAEAAGAATITTSLLSGSILSVAQRQAEIWRKT